MLGDLLLQAGFLGHELGVAAQQDVGAAAGHVGGNRDHAFAAGLRHDVSLALVLLGVQHLVPDAHPLQDAASFSDFSTEMVPTSTGWPFSWQSLISLAALRNFSSSVR